MRTHSYQSALADLMNRFIEHKRALGYRYLAEFRDLSSFDRFLALQDIHTPGELTPPLIENFLASRGHLAVKTYNHLLGTLSLLFKWMVLQEIIAASPVTMRPRRETAKRIPFLFTPEQARALLRVASELPDNPRSRFRGITYRTIFAILYGLGLRVGEVTRLLWRDVDFDRDLLVIRETKFNKNRFTPFGPRLSAQLREYRQQLQDDPTRLDPESPVFSFGTHNRRLNPSSVSQLFHQLVPQLQLKVSPGVSPPRLHDLRHSFAVGTLLRWYRSGLRPQERLIQLSTFMGHVSPVTTATYLTITTELLGEANQRFERFALPLVTEVTSCPQPA